MKEAFIQISVSGFKNEMKNSDVTIIDVRTPGELVIYGKITENQILIDINNPNFTFEISKLDKNKKYLLYCWHGNRTVVARNYMRSQGFIYVRDLRGGIDEWILKGEKVLF